MGQLGLNLPRRRPRRRRCGTDIWLLGAVGPRAEFTASRVMKWLRDRSVDPSFIPPGKPWHNDFVESFNGKLRDECLNLEWFRDLREARAVIESWRQFYNHRRPHSALGYLAPVQFREQRRNIAVHLTV